MPQRAQNWLLCQIFKNMSGKSGEMLICCFYSHATHIRQSAVKTQINMIGVMY